MAAVLMNTLIQLKFDWVLGNPETGPDLSCHLYNNIHTPACTDVPPAMTETTLAGYAAVNLIYANWVQSFVACVLTGVYPTITFTFTAGGQTIYGYYIFDSNSGEYMWAEEFTTAFTVPAGGGAIDLDLTYVEKQC